MIDRAVRDDFCTDSPLRESMRKGFGRGLVAAGRADARVVALSADLTESVSMTEFAHEFGSRFIQVGVAEQNLVTVASGLARAGKIPFAGSYAAFSPGRNWEQIRTTVCLNDMPVVVVGSHAGLGVGPDGATHQMLEDISLMRSLPNMTVIAPGDSIEAEKAAQVLAQHGKPGYLRLARNSTEVYTRDEDEFLLGQGYRLHQGDDVTVLATGTMTAIALRVARMLRREDILADVIHLPTIKPLDIDTIIESVEKTGRVVTCEEAQIAGGFGGAVSEVLSEKLPVPLLRIGVHDAFGESGGADELLSKYELDVDSVAGRVKNFVWNVPQYHRGY